MTSTPDRAPRQRVLAERYRTIRAVSMQLVEGLSAEDCLLQSMADASPVKWHLAHVSWFFETFVLEQAESAFQPFDASFRELFNSYYVGVGARFARSERGLLSRPSLERVFDYRRAIDQRLLTVLDGAPLAGLLLDTIELGLHHEQQHQELILTDLKHHFSRNPQYPVYRPAIELAVATVAPLSFMRFEGGHARSGHDGDGFAFDNEMPATTQLLQPFELARRLITNGEYLDFIEAGGYRRPELWLADGWDKCQLEGWQAPLYWFHAGGRWHHYTLGGARPVRDSEPVCHVSYYEAEACARWLNARLPTEHEWEHAARTASPQIAGHYLDSGLFHPAAADGAARHALQQLSGTVWQWTQSAYLPYPGFRTAPGAVGEYNGKFMINQMILRGASCVTPRDHTRPSYRNFFPPQTRWQFSGIRLARDVR